MRSRRRKRERKATAASLRRIEGSLLLGAVAALIIFVSLLPADEAARQACLACGNRMVIDAAVSMLMFGAVGAGLALVGLARRHAVIIAGVAAASIELLQLILPINRSASPIDIVTAVGGAAVGFHVVLNRRAILYPRSQRALEFAWLATGAWMLLLLGTAWAFQPLTLRAPVVGQWTPALDGMARYGGRVLGAHLSGVPLPDGPVERTAELSGSSQEGVHLDVTVEPGTRSYDFAPIVRVTSLGTREILLLGRTSDDLAYRAGIRARIFGLATPVVILRDAFIGRDRPATGSIEFSAEHRPGVVRLSSEDRAVSLPLHPGAGWMLLWPNGAVTQGPADAISGLWVLCPTFVIAYWVGRRARRRARRAGDAFRMTGTAGEIVRAAPFLALAVVVGLGGIAMVFDLSMPPPLVWGGAVTGIVLGLGVGVMRALAHATHGPQGVRVGSLPNVEVPRPAATGA
jgi:hypothetical protein